MLTINTNIFNNFSLNKPLQKSSFRNNSFKILNKDIFQKINTISPSFEGTKDNHKSKRTVLEVKKDILRLMCSIVLPLRIKFDGKLYFIDELEHGSTIQEAIKRIPFKDFDMQRLDETFGSKTIRKHLMDFEKLQKKLQPLYEEWSDIEKDQAAHSKNPVTLPNDYDNYIKSAKRSNISFTTTPNFSKPLRYTHIIKPFIDMVHDNMSIKKPSKILLVGLGMANEELYDYALYSLIASKNIKKDIKDIIDLEVIDYRPKKEFLYRDYLDPIHVSYVDNDKMPFNQDINNLLICHPLYNSKTYPLKVLEFVADKLEDDNKSHFATPIEDFSEDYQGEGYDFISINNVLQYVGQALYDDASSFPAKYRFLNPFKSYKMSDSLPFFGYRRLLNNLLKMVKPGGLISCQFDSAAFDKILYEQLSQLELFNNEFEKVQDGLYRRKNTDGRVCK